MASFTVAQPGPWAVMAQEGDTEPFAQAPREKLCRHPVKNNDSKWLGDRNVVGGRATGKRLSSSRNKFPCKSGECWWREATAHSFL